MGLKLPFGDGLEDAIWRGDRILSGMGLKMPFGDGLKDAIWNEYQKGVHALEHL